MNGEGAVVVKEEKKEKSLFGCLFRVAMFAVAVYGAVTALAKVMARLAKRLEEDNEGNEEKRFFTGLVKRDIYLEEEVSGIDVTVVAGCVELDLTEAELSEETFIKVRTLGGKVVIKVPAMTRVDVDDTNILSGFMNMVPNYEQDNMPVVHVKMQNLLSCVKIEMVTD